MPGTRKLGRPTDSRNAMLRAMVTYLFENGKIETTVTRAKEVRSMAEKMVTLGKQEDLHAKRQIFSYITKEDVAKKVIDEIPFLAHQHPGVIPVIMHLCQKHIATQFTFFHILGELRQHFLAATAQVGHPHRVDMRKGLQRYIGLVARKFGLFLPEGHHELGEIDPELAHRDGLGTGLAGITLVQTFDILGPCGQYSRRQKQQTEEDGCKNSFHNFSLFLNVLTL